MFFVGSGHHGADDHPISELPGVVGDYLRKQMLPAPVLEQLRGLPEQVDDADMVSIAEATKIIYSRGEQEDTGMKAKKSLSTYEHFHKVVVVLDEERRAEADFSFAWNNVLFVVSECEEGVRYTCPDVLNRFAAFKEEGAVAQARERADRECGRLFGSCSRAAAALFMQPALGAHLLASRALKCESDATDGMNPGNMHILMLLWNLGLIGILDFGEGVIRGAPNGISTGLWVADGGGAYMTPSASDKDGECRVYLNKKNSTGADFVVGRFKVLVNPCTYDRALQNIELETVSDFTQHGVR
eukprot:797595-Rhodomonas_salina.1